MTHAPTRPLRPPARLAAVLAAAVAAASFSSACRPRPPDLSKGGLELVYGFEGVSDEAEVEKARAVMARRLEQLKIPAVVARAGAKVRVVLPAGRGATAERMQQAKDVLGRVGRLEFREVDRGAFLPALVRALPEGSGLALASENPFESEGPSFAVEAQSDAAARSEALQQIRQGLPAQVELLPEPKQDRRQERAKGFVFRPVLAAAVTGADVKVAKAVDDPDWGPPLVSLELTELGAKAFHQLTARIVHRQLAIVLDGTITSAPWVQTPIAGGRAQVTLGGWGSREELLAEAEVLAAALTAGVLPARPLLESENVVGPAR